jgi:UDP-N-acetylmuramoyl-tripeptide--D-alanyl-D-alanine ligase
MSGRLLQGDESVLFHGASIDSRSVNAGQLFFAIEGENNDGHDYVAAARTGGAVGAVIHHALEGENRAALAQVQDFAVIEVANTFDALHALTRAVRNDTPEKLVAITGSAGKTTTKEFLAALLATRYRTAATPGNYNNLYGFPLSLLGIPDDCEWMVAEMGMSGPGELGQVSELGRPDVALFTNVRAAHLEGFEDNEDGGADPSDVEGLKRIAEAKSELLNGLVRGGRIIANACDPHVVSLVDRYVTEVDDTAQVVWYAIDREAARRSPAVWVTECRSRPTPLVGSSFTIEFFPEFRPELRAKSASGKSLRDVNITLPVHGQVNVENFLAAAACALSLGISPEAVATAGARLGAAAGRGRFVRHRSGALVIDDSYNSNPDAATRALAAAAGVAGQRHWCLLGDMLELGRRSETFHREIARSAVELGFSPIWVVGSHSRHIVDEVEGQTDVDVRWFENADAAVRPVLSELRAGDVLLIKGSRGIGLDRVVAAVHSEANGEGA